MEIVIGILFGIASFGGCLLMLAWAPKVGSDETRKWLEPHWKDRSETGKEKARELKRIADALENNLMASVNYVCEKCGRDMWPFAGKHYGSYGCLKCGISMRPGTKPPLPHKE